MSIPKWEDVGSDVLETMEFLGNFAPVINERDRAIKGYMADHQDGGVLKVYLSSEELKNMAFHFLKVADWLEKRAERPAGEERK